jgi:hypothetical protein
MRLGHGHRRSVVILWAWTAALCGLVLYPTFTNKGNAIIPFAVAGLGILLYTLFHPGVRNHRPVVVTDVTEGEAGAAGAGKGAGKGAGGKGKPAPPGEHLADVVDLTQRH